MKPTLPRNELSEEELTELRLAIYTTIAGAIETHKPRGAGAVLYMICQVCANLMVPMVMKANDITDPNMIRAAMCRGFANIINEAIDHHIKPRRH